MNDWRAWLRNQSPWNLGALIAVTALAGWLLFVIPKLFFALLALFVLGVVMAKLSEPLGQDEAGVVSGWWDHRIKVVLKGRIFLPPGAILTKISLQWQPIEFRVTCQSSDEVPLTLDLRTAFRIPRDEQAIRTVSEHFGEDTENMHRQVIDTLVVHIRDVVGERAMGQVDRDFGKIADEVMWRSRPALVEMGFEPRPLSVANVVLPADWVAEREKKISLDAHLRTLTTKLAIEDQISATRSRREANERLTAERARADADTYAELRRLEVARARIAVADESRASERDHARALAELEAYKLAERLRIEGGHHEENIQRMIVERLPEILEAKGKLLPNLRTYIAGSHDKGLVSLMTGLAGFGPDIMRELTNLIGSLSGGPTAEFSSDGPRPQIAAADGSSADAAVRTAQQDASHAEVVESPTE
ncbi:SPFH domain-containing protein [Frankia sp. Cj3]|uniref:SPFH domain-containing protein n=3 Tax=unclassified Frankia TaxID=2632575 RepID=UPI001EF5D5C1|nr:SPFH domain-containing protein [Frankia sp. Cj3]